MKRERIEHEHGVYVARRELVANYVGGDDPYIVVRFTHDFARAAEIAWPLWREYFDNRRLGRPYRDWCRIANWDMCGEGWAYTWLSGETPGRPGVFPVVAFEHLENSADILTPAGLEFERTLRAAR